MMPLTQKPKVQYNPNDPIQFNQLAKDEIKWDMLPVQNTSFVLDTYRLAIAGTLDFMFMENAYPHHFYHVLSEDSSFEAFFLTPAFSAEKHVGYYGYALDKSVSLLELNLIYGNLKAAQCIIDEARTRQITVKLQTTRVKLLAPSHNNRTTLDKLQSFLVHHQFQNTSQSHACSTESCLHQAALDRRINDMKLYANVLPSEAAWSQLSNVARQLAREKHVDALACLWDNCIQPHAANPVQVNQKFFTASMIALTAIALRLDQYTLMIGTTLILMMLLNEFFSEHQLLILLDDLASIADYNHGQSLADFVANKQQQLTLHHARQSGANFSHQLNSIANRYSLFDNRLSQHLIAAKDQIAETFIHRIESSRLN